MDYTRFVLFAGLAIITYLMLLAWQEDYPPVVESASAPQSTQQQLANDIPTNLDVNNSIDTPNISTSPLSSDVPTQVPVVGSNPSVTSTVSTTTPATAARLITVETDTFQLRINLDGGDIIYLALPKYQNQLSGDEDPFVLLNDNNLQSYVSQSGLIGTNGIDSQSRASYNSSAQQYQMSDSDSTLVVDLQISDSNGVEITKRFSFTRDSYLIDISYLVNNNAASPWQANAFGQLKRNQFDDPSSTGSFVRSFLGFVTTSADDPYIKFDFEDVDDGINSINTDGGWVGFSQQYFITTWIPPVQNLNQYSFRRNSANQYIGGFTSSSFSVQPGASETHSMQFYAGPKDQYVLRDISENLDLTIDYGILWFLAAPIYWLLTKIQSFVINYGVAIILLTVVVKGIFYKLSETQYKSMAGMRRAMPKLQQLKERYGDDRMKLQKATMDLYKKEKINPFGGCLPMLVQMPVFIALYWVLMRSVELRHAPFILWLEDLSVRDPFFILPLLMGATMFLQTKLSPTPADPMQARVMTIMPVMMTVFFLWFPAGLVLYWLTNSALGILQQWYITRKVERAYDAKSA